MRCEMRAGFLHVHLDKRYGGWRVEDVLTTALALPMAFSQKLLAAGHVVAGKQTLRRGDELKAGSRLVLKDPTPVSGWPESSGRGVAGFAICYEDDHVLVVNKPAGVIVHSDNPSDLTLDGLVARYYQETGQVLPILHAHRLDRPTTGAVVYAKHGFAARALDAQLVRHRMARRYVAVVCGAELARSQTVDKPIGRDRHRSSFYRVSSTGKEARTHILVRAVSPLQGEHLSLLSCELETGRTHQIRVHCASIGAPILGDVEYGGQRIDHWPARDAIALHACEVSFYHPYDEQDVVVKCPLSNDWSTFLRQEWGIEDDLW
ncbi:RluA family pseudouridine synthase [Alicyclobacillus fastidiosus]|uniref:Pseudouridine synthase n=1 Tax=Alicyclobacillus fastidiosus TaxID=392011 RepID=A0ABV5ADI2_9BACL|nr:RluA family pseudouridine synthase [Alicyclobacillus fastidiosus]WEH08653.1 RluA family pseudouridine synthase [Alicyclobacillus fastidiosus]